MGACASAPATADKQPDSTSAPQGKNVQPSEQTRTTGYKDGQGSGQVLKSQDSGGSDLDLGPVVDRTPAKRMKLKELRAATDDFAEANLLGEGSFGKVYSGSIQETGRSASGRSDDLAKPTRIAVKKLNPDSFQGYQEWLAEVLLLDKLRHPNLVRLVGYCNERREALLVYELCPNGSLEDALFKGVGEQQKEVLTWAQRVQIARDMTAGLLFLHKQNIIHRDFKASNILLMEGMRATVTDFGLAKAGPDGNKTHVSTRVMGTLGYLDPTYMSTGRLTKKSDTYALGVTFLEMVTGRQSAGSERSENLTTWVKPHLMQKRPDFNSLVDPRLGDNYSRPGVVKLTILAKHCVNDDPAMRPELEIVLESLTKVDM